MVIRGCLSTGLFVVFHGADIAPVPAAELPVVFNTSW